MTTALLVPAQDAYVLFTDRLMTTCTLDALSDATLPGFKDMFVRDPCSILCLEDTRKALVSPDERSVVGTASRHAHAALDALGRLMELGAPLPYAGYEHLDDLFTSFFEARGYRGRSDAAAAETIVAHALLGRGIFEYQGTAVSRRSALRFGSGSEYLDEACHGIGELESGTLDADHAIELAYPWFASAVERDLFSSGVECTLLSPNGSTQQVLESPQLDQNLRPYLRYFRSSAHALAFDRFERHYSSMFVMRSRIGP